MAPPTQLLNLDVEAISGICGSISIACWVVVFSPQIVENFRRSSADGLSIQFIIVWLLGDVFNILGAVLQGVLPTMIILAIYYTIADIVLLGQCFYYRGFTFRDYVPEPTPPAAPLPKPTNGQHSHPDERTSLLSTTRRGSDYYDGAGDDETLALYRERERRGSDWSHLNPAVPLVLPEELESQIAAPPARPAPSPPTRLQSFLFNSLAVLMVCAAGVAGWVLSRDYSVKHNNDHSSPPKDSGDVLELNFWGQVFGWLCAALYLGSRLPQLLLNFRRKSTEGVSILFFLFACLGNLTYVMSILAFEPDCSGPNASKGSDKTAECAPGEAAHIYWEYMLVNLSWLAGSAGTLLLDFAIFVQFFLYNKEVDEGEEDEGYESDEGLDEEEDEQEEEDGEQSLIGGGANGGRRQQRRGDYEQRPVLDRGMSDYTR
ncbi:PQ-loop repeat-containing protein 2 [Rhypophila decipiens]|uniref:PQ-loop repeat-containing protein 2 n=1 Tax=Rhypophila decipiens TaxID=261697 RepID=A0AAN6Y1M5_9PEZI|nr:PQ-loop repeat-containing protein 2 [Rhypophila decipiens]